MSSKMSEQMALFKFTLIAPVVNQTHSESSKMAYFRKVAAESYTLPDGRQVSFAPSTIKSWFLEYQHGGLDTLRKARRRDCGQSRALTEEHKAGIDRYRPNFPQRL